MIRPTRCFMVIAALVTLVSVLEARTWRVEKDGGGDFAILYEAIDAAAAGDTIRIGPGRFEEYRYEPDYARETYCCANITTPDLTLLGAGAEQTVIGLEAYDPHLEHFVIGILCNTVDVTIRDLTVNGVQGGVELFEASNIEMSDCRFTDSRINVVLGGSTGVTIENCLLAGWHSLGLFTQFDDNVSVRNCEFIDGVGKAIAAVGGDGWVVRDCVVRDCTAGLQFERGAAGVVERCHVQTSGGNAPAISLASGASMSLHDNRFEDDGYAAHLGTGGPLVTAENNVFIGGPYTCLLIGLTPVDFRQNHIINGGGHSVLAQWEQGDLEEPYRLDLTGNYWGTTDPAQIAAWIDDYHDYHPLEGWHFVIVDYEPFEDQPVEVEQHSWSEVKELFRGQSGDGR